ncbi:MAG: Hsp33 family molecular chaperone HslO [Christensenellales bacterium]|jgi:molecular chaperone Hsp33
MADILIKGIIDGYVNVYAIDGREMVEEARLTHGTWPVCTAALGRALMATAMMAEMIKHDDGRLSVTIKGGGPAGSIVTAGRPGGFVKGYIDEPRVDLPTNAKGKLDVGGAVGRDGRLTVVKDLGMKEPYSGSVRLVSGELGEDFAAYFAISEQQPAAVYLGVMISPDEKVLSAGGFIIMPMPQCPEETIQKLENAMPRALKMSAELAAGKPISNFLISAFEGMDFKVTETGGATFECDCGEDRIEQVLVSLGKEELEDMLVQDDGAEITCHFCMKKYTFSGDELRRVIDDASQPNNGARQ